VIRTRLLAAMALTLAGVVTLFTSPADVLHSQTPSPTQSATATQAATATPATQATQTPSPTPTATQTLPPTPVSTQACGLSATRTTPPQRLNLNQAGSRSVQLPDGTYIINTQDSDMVLFVCHVPTNSSIRFDYRVGCELSRTASSAGGTSVLNQIASGGVGACSPTSPQAPSPRPPRTGDGGLLVDNAMSSKVPSGAFI
jgi:hypothetical protein